MCPRLESLEGGLGASPRKFASPRPNYAAKVLAAMSSLPAPEVPGESVTW